MSQPFEIPDPVAVVAKYRPALITSYDHVIQPPSHLQS
jgi:hypothetical protein